MFPKSSVGYIIGKEGTWIKDLCDKCGVSIKFQQDTSIRCLRKDDAICVMIKDSLKLKFIIRLSKANSQGL